MSEHATADTLDDLLDHEYDGIREYDNPCPGWWQWLFFLSAVFSAVYFFHFHIGKVGMTVEKAHEHAIADDLRVRFAEIGELKPDDATLLAYMQKADWLQVGTAVYGQRCKSCHGDEGRGLVGPNLTDDYYKNVRQLSDLPRVIAEGAANGSMPAWKTRLHPNEIVLVAAYVASLRGKNLPGPRPRDGDPIPPWPSSAAAAPSTVDRSAEPAAVQPAADADDKQPSESEKSTKKTATQ
ncbi:MAG: cbb3-type cytochrome c oxidase N-terminal domain-containing protein [Pirellulaceae bacterium]